MEMKHKELTDQIIGCYYEVYNELGFGFLESVYQNAMFCEMQDRGLDIVAQQRIQVNYKSRVVGQFATDILVNGLVIVELKAKSCLTEEHETQLLNYLKATNIEVGLLFNFGTEPDFARKIWDNHLKERNQKPRK